MAVSVVVLIVNHGHLARPITGINSFIKSPNIQFTNPIALMSFIVYAIFAYGGMETTGGIVNQVNNPKKNYPRGIIIAAIIMTLTYSFSIFFVGVTTNWNKVLGNEKVNLGNITYVLVNNLGFVTAKTFGLSNGIAILFGGSGTQKFYLILTDMGNISSAVPYLFLIGAFPFFKRLQEIDRPFVFFKPGWKTKVIMIIMMFIITLGIGFTAIQPIISKDFETAFWTIIGPLFFGLLGWLLYENGIRNIKLLEK